MTLSDVLTIIAVLLAPLVAVQVSTYLERRRDQRQRRLNVFRTLMSTRAAKLSPEHVQALNMIDIEFAGSDKNLRAVVNAWKAYLDHLNDSSLSMEVWSSRREDFFVDLLHTMATALGYDYDKTHIRRTSYYPKGFGDSEWDQLTIRKAFREVLEGKRWIPIWANIAPQQQPVEQAELDSPQQLSQATEMEQIEPPADQA